jgi:hypothetical protein
LTSKPNTATHSGQTVCENCHKSTSGWSGAKVDHSTFTVATNCGSCHNGTSATAKDANHIPTTANCGTCHKYPSWTPAKFHANVSVITGCASCHATSAYGLTSKPNTATHSGQTVCENCHKSTSGWSGAKVDHSTFTVATNCGSCHNGTSATAKDANHIPTTANCGTCHKYPSWLPAKFHTNVSVLTGCATCHATAAYGLTSKPNTATHSGVTVCETCHKSTGNWSSVQFAHSAANAVGTGTCDTCHNGSTALGKSASHIPVVAGLAKCDSCHKSQVSFNTAVTMNHSVVSTATCKSCHSGTYTSQGNNGGAMAKPANHVPEAQLLNGSAMDCNTCHSSTSAWSTEKMNHNNSMGNGAGWCKSCHATGTSYLGNMEKKALTHQAKSGTTPTDCSMSGCHKPLGSKGSAYSKWD